MPICAIVSGLALASFFSVILAYNTMNTMQEMLPKMAGVSAPIKYAAQNCTASDKPPTTAASMILGTMYFLDASVSSKITKGTRNIKANS